MRRSLLGGGIGAVAQISVVRQAAHVHGAPHSLQSIAQLSSQQRPCSDHKMDLKASCTAKCFNPAPERHAECQATSLRSCCKQGNVGKGRCSSHLFGGLILRLRLGKGHLRGVLPLRRQGCQDSGVHPCTMHRYAVSCKVS